MRLWHGRDVGRMVGPRTNTVDWLDHTQIGHVAVAAAEEVLTRRVARGWRMCC